jgi:hypothetical protein
MLLWKRLKMRRIRRRKKRDRIRLFCSIANFIAKYFGCKVPRHSTSPLAPASKFEGEGKLSACIHIDIHDPLPCYIERYSNNTQKPAATPWKSTSLCLCLRPGRMRNLVEEQVVVPSAQDPVNPPVEKHIVAPLLETQSLS